MKNWLLPVGLLFCVFAAFVFPQQGIYLKQLHLIPVLIMIVFWVNGYQLPIQEMRWDQKMIKGFVLIVGVSLFLGPFIGLQISELFQLSAPISFGLILMSAMPATLSSGIVICRLGNANPFWALFYTVGLNCLGVLTIPFMLKLSLNISHAISIAPFQMLIKLLILVLIPLGIGILAQRLTPVLKKLPFLSYIPTFCVLITVWISFCDSSALLLMIQPQIVLKVLLSCFCVHTILVLILWVSGQKGLKLDRPELLSVVFIGSQKTLPVALSVLIMSQYSNGLALVVILFFHFIQLIEDSLIASKFKASVSEI